jgi:hypothetical protein
MHFRSSLALVIVLSGCVSEYGSDNLASPNWDNRHNAFLGTYINGQIGRQYESANCTQTPKCSVQELDIMTLRYVFTDSPYAGCTYWYDVNKETRRILRADFKGTKQTCFRTLN